MRNCLLVGGKEDGLNIMKSHFGNHGNVRLRKKQKNKKQKKK